VDTKFTNVLKSCSWFKFWQRFNRWLQQPNP